MKEPGQTVWERLWNRPGKSSWGFVGPNARERFAAVEAAVRADERAKVIEECAARCEGYMRTGERLWKQEADGDRAALHLVQAYAARDLAAAIRNLGESAP